MKNSISILSILTLFLFVATSCRNKESEKRIAELESKVAELEGKQSPASVTPAPTNSEEPRPEGPMAAFAFENMDHDFGTMKEGDVVKYTYKFKNTGDAPLIIQNVQGSCGCTTPEWTKDPVPVGGEGFITAQFNSAGKSNLQNKTVTITANTWPETTTLKFTAMVEPKDKQ